MMQLQFGAGSGEGLRILCLGAHSDDIEIGCGGTILRIAGQHSDCEIHWVVFSASGVRRAEAERGAELFAGKNLKTASFKEFRDGFMPYNGAEIKGVFESELKQIAPDLIFTHYGGDAHQDHRTISELTRNTFRNHMILEYEIPKYDGDLGRPHVFVPLERAVCEAKVQHLSEAFHSQTTKHWFEAETFNALMRLRGMECASTSGYAEAFYARKLVL